MNGDAADRPPAADHNHIEALARGLKVLEVFSRERPELSLTEIAAAIGLLKGSALRVVRTLEGLGYLQRDPRTRLYRPGLQVLRLGFSALNSEPLVELARPHLAALCNEIGETTDLAIRDGRDALLIVFCPVARTLSANAQVGARLPLHCSGVGKALLMDATADEIGRLLGPGPYAVPGPQAITRPADLLADLERARRQGYAIAYDELEVGVCSAAAPVRSGGRIVAAVSATAVTVRISRAELETALAPRVLRTASQISQALGALQI